MHDIENTAVVSGLRAVRRIAPPHAPWPATLIRLPDDSSGMLVDRELLGGWPGWDAEGIEHTLAPLDVVRRADGHDVLFPRCVESLESFLDRRVRDGPELRDGEIVTLAVSVLRGLVSASATHKGDAACGTWWLTEAGKPVLVRSRRRGDASSPLTRLMLTTRDGGLREELEQISEALNDPEVLRRLAPAADARLLAAAAASPLDLVTHERRPDRSEARAVTIVGQSAESAGSIVSRGRERIDEWIERSGRILARLTKKLHRSPDAPGAKNARRRLGPALMAAGAVAGTILLFGVLWPAGDAPPVESSTSEPAPAATAPPPGQPTMPTGASLADAAPSDPDLVAATTQLLAQRSACVPSGATASCLAGVLEDPRRGISPGIVDAPPERQLVTLLDSFGGVAVLRIDDNDGELPSQLAVVTAKEDRWLLRDVYDAEQPP